MPLYHKYILKHVIKDLFIACFKNTNNIFSVLRPMCNCKKKCFIMWAPNRLSWLQSNLGGGVFHADVRLSSHNFPVAGVIPIKPGAI